MADKNLSLWLRDFETCGDPVLEKSRSLALDFMTAIETNSQPPYWLTLAGNSGTGKTFLLELVERWFKLNGCLYTDRAGTMLARRYSFCQWEKFLGECKNMDYSRRVDLQNDWFVTLDEAFWQTDKPCWRDLSFEILNARLGKWTMLTTNQEYDSIQLLDQRIADRLIRGKNKFYEVKTMSYAVRKRLQP